jgi:hypothetical protein
MESLLAATGIRMASKSERLRVPFSNKKLTAIIVQFYQKFSTTIGIHEIKAIVPKAIRNCESINKLAINQTNSHN